MRTWGALTLPDFLQDSPKRQKTSKKQHISKYHEDAPSDLDRGDLPMLTLQQWFLTRASVLASYGCCTSFFSPLIRQRVALSVFRGPRIWAFAPTSVDDCMLPLARQTGPMYGVTETFGRDFLKKCCVFCGLKTCSTFFWHWLSGCYVTNVFRGISEVGERLQDLMPKHHFTPMPIHGRSRLDRDVRPSTSANVSSPKATRPRC